MSDCVLHTTHSLSLPSLTFVIKSALAMAIKNIMLIFCQITKRHQVQCHCQGTDIVIYNVYCDLGSKRYNFIKVTRPSPATALAQSNLIQLNYAVYVIILAVVSCC